MVGIIFPSDYRDNKSSNPVPIFLLQEVAQRKVGKWNSPERGNFYTKLTKNSPNAVNYALACLALRLQMIVCLFTQHIGR